MPLLDRKKDLKIANDEVILPMKLSFDDDEEEKKKNEAKDKCSLSSHLVSNIISDSPNNFDEDVDSASRNQSNMNSSNLDFDEHKTCSQEPLLIDSPIVELENVDPDSSIMSSSRSNGTPKAVEVCPVSDSDDEYQKDQADQEEPKKELSNFVVMQEEEEDDIVLNTREPLLVPLDDGENNSKCMNPSPDVNIQRSNSSRSTSHNDSRINEDDKQEDIVSLPVKNNQGGYVDEKNKHKGSHRIKYKLKVQHFQRTGHKKVIERTRIPSPPSSSLSNESNKPSSTKIKNSISTEEASNETSVDNTKTNSSCVEDPVDQARRMKKLRSQVMNLRHHHRLITSSCTDIITRIELDSIKKQRAHLDIIPSDSIEVSPDEALLLLKKKTFADCYTQTPFLDLDSILAELSANEKIEKVRPILEKNYRDQKAYHSSLLKKHQSLSKENTKLTREFMEIDLQLNRLMDDKKNHITPAMRKRMALEEQLKSKKEIESQFEGKKKQKMKNVTNVRIRIKDVQCCIEMIKKRIQEQLKMPKQNVPVLVKKLESFKLKDKENRKEMKMMKIEESSLSNATKELNHVKKVAAVKIAKDNQKMLADIATAREQFMAKYKPRNTEGLFLIDHLESLESREVVLDTYLREKDRCINELKNKIVTLARGLYSSHVKFPRNKNVKLPF